MNEQAFELLKKDPTTIDFLAWIVTECKSGGMSKRTMVRIIKELYTNKRNV